MMNPDEIEMLYIESSGIGLVEFRKRVADIIVKERLAERRAVALDNYSGHTFSDSTNWEGKYKKFIDNNEKRIQELKNHGVQ